MIDWILGGCMTAFAIVGLFLASAAYDTGMYTFGIGLFAFGAFFDFWLVKRTFDAKERQVAEAKAVEEMKVAAN